MTAEMCLEAKIARTIQEIETHYTNLCNRLQEQKNTYINALKALKNWVIGLQGKMVLLEQRESEVRRDITLPPVAIQAAVDSTRTERARIQRVVRGRDFTFEWNTDIELRAIRVGLLLYKEKEGFDDIMRVNFGQRFDIISNCRKGREQGNLFFPKGVTVEPLRDQILIANFGNNSVDIFSSTGQFKSRFGVENGIELDGPNGIVTFNNEIYISNLRSNCITVHSFNGGTLLRRVGKKGSGALEFSCPEGLAVIAHDNTCLLYVADRENNRIRVLNGNLKFQCDIGKYREISL